MEDLTLTRFAYTPLGVFGQCMVSGLELVTVERPWLGNQPMISCIPEGTYQCVPGLFVRGGYPAIEITAVPGRSGILFHIGNTLHDVKGCIAVGFALGCVNGLWAVLHSKEAFAHLMAAYGAAPFQLTIKRLPLLERASLV